MTREILCAMNFLESSNMLLLYLLKKSTSRMTVFMLNPPSNILVIWLANVVVVLTQSLHVLSPHGKHSKNLLPSSTTLQSKQNVEGMSSTKVWDKCFYMVAIPGQLWLKMLSNYIVTADSGMVRWICGVSLEDRIPTTDLLLHLCLSSINGMLHWNLLQFHGHLIYMMIMHCLKRQLPCIMLMADNQKVDQVRSSVVWSMWIWSH